MHCAFLIQLSVMQMISGSLLKPFTKSTGCSNSLCKDRMFNCKTNILEFIDLKTLEFFL